MKKLVFLLAFAALVPVSKVQAYNVGFNVGVNIGTPAPVYVNPPVTIVRQPTFVTPPELGFGVATGVPYDLFSFGGRYYLCRDNVWYSAAGYRGPWVTVRYREVPYGLRRHPFDRIHYYRDRYHGPDYYHANRPDYYHRWHGRDWEGHRGPGRYDRGPGGWDGHDRGRGGHGGWHR